jgi:hypothetical protein
VVDARRRRGPVFGTRIWSSKWDRKFDHGRAKTATVVSNFWRWGLAILCVCGAIGRPPFAPFADPHPTPTRLALEAAQPAAPQSNGGAALAWLARRARGHAPRDDEQCRFSTLPPCSCPAQRSYFEDRFSCPFIVKLCSSSRVSTHECLPSYNATTIVLPY